MNTVKDNDVVRKFLMLMGIMSFFLLAACSGDDVAVDELPAGDAARGEHLFAQSVDGAPACSSCHTLDGTSGAGPSLQGYATVAAGRQSNTSAESYTFTSIVRPAAHIVSGYGNIMYSQYERRLSAQQIADLIAYLLTL